MRKIVSDISVSDSDRVNIANSFLKLALAHLVEAGCPKAAQRVRLALSSVRGALSNTRHRESAAARGETRKKIKRAPKIEIRNIDMSAQPQERK